MWRIAWHAYDEKRIQLFFGCSDKDGSFVDGNDTCMICHDRHAKLTSDVEKKKLNCTKAVVRNYPVHILCFARRPREDSQVKYQYNFEFA